MTGVRSTQLGGELKKVLGVVETFNGLSGEISHHFKWASTQPFVSHGKSKIGFAQDLHGHLVETLELLFTTNPSFGYVIDETNTFVEDLHCEIAVLEAEGDGDFAIEINSTGELKVDFTYMDGHTVKNDTEKLFVNIWGTSNTQAAALVLKMMGQCDELFKDELAQSVRDRHLRIETQDLNA